VLYDGLNDTLESTVTHIEPIKIFKRVNSESTVFCRVQLADSRETHVWVKTLNLNRTPRVSEKRTIRDYDLTQHLYKTLDQSDHFLVPRPLFHSPEHRLIVTQHMQGERLQDKIARSARWMSAKAQQKSLEKDCYQAGQWLRAFQEATRNYCPGMSHGLELLKVKDTERIAEQTIDRLEQLTQNNSSALDRRLISSIKEFLAHNLAEYDKNEDTKNDYICSVHGDFFPGNLLSNGNTIIGLDFSSSTWGSRYFDLSYFVFQVETVCGNITYPQSLKRLLTTALVSGYENIPLEENFWYSNPAISNNFISHCISRLLSLSDSKWNILTPRFFYRKFNFYATRKRLIQHIRKRSS